MNENGAYLYIDYSLAIRMYTMRDYQCQSSIGDLDWSLSYGLMTNYKYSIFSTAYPFTQTIAIGKNFNNSLYQI